MPNQQDKLLRSSEIGLLLQVGVQFIAGGLLSTQYHAGSQAYNSVFLMRKEPFWSFLAGVHYWGSALLIITSFVHLIALLLAGKYLESKGRWYGALMVFMGAYGAQLTGNVLPMDRHGVQTANIEAGLTSSVPVVGQTIHQVLLAGSTFTPATANRWFLLHESLILIITLVGAVLLVKNYHRNTRDKANLLGFIPIVLLAVTAALLRPPLGQPATPADYGQFQAYVSWYTWPLHGMLQLFNKIGPSYGWIGFALVPGLFVAYLIVLPFLAKRLKRTWAESIPFAFCLTFLLAGFLSGSPIAKLTGNRDPAPIQAIVVQTTPLTPSQIQIASAGRDLFNSQGCNSCHGQDGDKGSVGPTLTNEQSLETPAWVAKFIRNPKSFRPSTMMPSFPNLTESQASQIAAWICLSPSDKKQIQTSKK